MFTRRGSVSYFLLSKSQNVEIKKASVTVYIFALINSLFFALESVMRNFFWRQKKKKLHNTITDVKSFVA